jgi:hypothetical protein
LHEAPPLALPTNLPFCEYNNNPTISANAYFQFLNSALVQGLRYNPPVTIEEWPDLDDLWGSEASNEDEPMPVDGPDRDPEFVERDQPPGLDPNDEPLLTDEEMIELLEMELGDLDDSDEWVDMRKLACPSLTIQITDVFCTRYTSYHIQRPHHPSVPCYSASYPLLTPNLRRPPSWRLRRPQDPK